MQQIPVVAIAVAANSNTRTFELEDVAFDLFELFTIANHASICHAPEKIHYFGLISKG